MTKQLVLATFALFVGFPSLGFGIEASTGAGVVAVSSELTPVSVSLDPVVEVAALEDEDHQRVDEALALYRDVGLELPDLDVRFRDEDADCRGHDGYFDPSTQPWTISVCSGAKFVLPHELAHAWEAANLSDDDRDQYEAVRGFETWNGKNYAWNERAIEDAAFMIQQNLMAGAHVDADSDRWRDRIAAYELLTSTESPVLTR